jgi:hypothetical protein
MENIIVVCEFIVQNRDKMGGQIEEKKQALWRLLRVAWATF